jgi:hypothetical protein
MSAERIDTPQFRRTLGALEAARRRHVSATWKWAGALAVIAAMAALYFHADSGSWLGGFFSALAALVVWIFVLSRQSRKFAGVFKATVMPDLVGALGENLTYDPSGYLDVDEFEECGLFISPDRYGGMDLVEGYVGETHVRFSLVHAEEEYEVTDTVTDTDSNGNTTTSTEPRTEYRDIFRGLLVSADCNKYFHGRTLVAAGSSSFFTRLRSSFVQLEDPRFNKLFTVTSTDQVEARYLLTPSLMERIVELRERTRGLQLSFADDRVYLALPMKLDTFYPSMWRRIDNPEVVSTYFETLQFIVGIVDDLNLNTRIWSKGTDKPRRNRT